jgi:ribosomal protein L22
METTRINQPAATPPTIAQLPVRLRDLLRREVCLEISRAQIEQALAQVEQEAAVLKKTRPPFLFLHAKPTRTEFETKEAGANESLAALAEGLRQVVAAQPRLRSWVEDDLETFLRDSQPAYMAGLAAHKYPDDWQRAIMRFDQRVAGFRATLGSVQAVLGAVPGGTVLASHAGAFEQLMPARQWGSLMDYELLFFNRVADIQRRSAELGADTLKRTTEHHFGAQVAQWARMDAVAVRKSMQELRANLELTAMDARAVYVAEAALAASAGGSTVRSFAQPMWEALRLLMRLEIDPAEVESVVAETERMVAAAGG